MSKSKTINNTDYELIKGHLLAPEKTKLSPDQEFQLERLMSAARILDKNPTLKHAIALHRAKYPELGQNQAWNDVQKARRLFNTIHEFDFDFWQTWLINDIVENIKQARTGNTAADRRVIAQEHANLIKAIGEKPTEMNDPRLTEQHEFFILIQTETGQRKLSDQEIKQLPAAARSEITRMIFQAQEITDIEAEQIMNT